MGELRVYWQAFKSMLAVRLEYRADLWLSTFGAIIFQLGPFLSFLVLNQHIKVMAGFNADQVLFLFGMWALVLGLSELFFNHIWDLSDIVMEGTLDRLLVYPVHSLPFFLISSPTLHSFTNVATGSAMILVAGLKLHIGWQAWALIPFWAACGVAVYTGILVAVGTLTIFIPGRGLDLLWLVAQVNWAARYPVKIYPAFMRVMLLVLPPLAVYHYLPALWIFGQGGSLAQALLAPLAAALAVGGLAVLSWNRALERYESTGS